MATYTGTSGNETWNLVSPGTFSLDGLGGTDQLNLGTSLRSEYSITQASDGSVQVDSISSASGGALLHATLYNIEVLTFNNGSDVLDLTTAFGPPPDTTPPTVSTFSPADAATGIAIASNIVVTFSETIQRGTGSIVLKNVAGTVIETFNAATSSLLTISGTTLTINPTSNLANSTNYFVTFASGNIKDLAGNAYAGITTYDFTTIAAATTGITLTGGAGNDTLTGGAGNDIINGGAGIDISTYSAARVSYTLTKTSTGYTVSGGTDGSDTLTNIERLSFTDKKVAIDLDGNAGITAKILGAVFGAASVSNTTYVGIGLSYLDGGMSYENLMQLAIDANLGAGASHLAVVNLLYTNVVGTAPSAGDRDYFVGLLDSGAFTVASLGVMAADHILNTDHINLVGLAQTGIEYI